MSMGFVVDKGNESVPGVQNWVSGMPEKSFLTGLKLKGRDVLIVQTYRCSQCGYLESYAPGAMLKSGGP
ncbi:MAG: hypothetical protein ABJE47_06925 [bacterium]